MECLKDAKPFQRISYTERRQLQQPNAAAEAAFDIAKTAPTQSQLVSLILRHPPAVNNLYFDMIMPAKAPKWKPYVRRVLSSEGKAYKEHVAEVANGLAPFLGDVWVTFRWYRPRRDGDLDGIFKIILDGLTGYVYNDDRQVARIHADRFDDKFRPRVEVDIRPLGLC